MGTKGSFIGVYLKLVLTALFWGGTFIAGRMLASEMTAFCAAFLRFLIAAVVLIGVVWHSRQPLPKLGWQQMALVGVLGMTGIFTYNFFFFKGLQLIEAGRAAVIVAQNPILIALFSAYFFRERLTPLKILAIALSVSGAVIVITRGDVASLWQGGVGRGEAYILGCVASWVTYSLVGKVLMKHVSPLLSVTYSVWIGTLALAWPAYHEGLLAHLPRYSGIAWASVAYLAVFGTVLGFIWFYQGIQRLGPTQAGLFINFVPVSAVLLSAVLLHEPLTRSLFLGGALVISGVFLMNFRPANANASLKK